MKLAILPLALFALALSAVAQEKKDGPKLADLKKTADGAYILFNGTDLTGWDGNPDFWSVQDGCLTGQTTAEKPTKGNTFCIYRGETPGDFELHAMYKLYNHNSGIQYRSKDLGKWVVHGYQADMDGADQYTGILYEEGGRGIVANVGTKVTIGADGKKAEEKVTNPADIRAGYKKGDWNEYIIICKGNTCTQKINGKTTIELVDNEAAKRALTGILALQLHAGPAMKVQFKDITLKPLP